MNRNAVYPDPANPVPTVRRPTALSPDTSSPASVRLRQFLIDENPRFSIQELMWITGICALSITLVTALGVFGVLILFLGSGVASLLLGGRLRQPAKLRFWNQFLWGALMPLACIFGDPFVFGRFERGQPGMLYDHAIGCYVFLGWQVMCLSASWVLPAAYARINEFLAGSLMAGAIFAWLIGLLLTPFAFFGLVILVGAVGLTPWITGYYFSKSAVMHWRRARKHRHSGSGWTLAIAGFAWAIGVALLAYLWSAPVGPDQYPTGGII